MRKLTANSFEAETSDGVVLVDFYAEWCGPCKAMTPMLDDLADSYEDKAAVVKVDIEAESELAIQFSIQSLPTLLFFKDGKQVEKLMGSQSRAVIEEKLEELL